MEIEEKILKVKKEIKERLDENKIRIVTLNAYFHERSIQRDGSFKNVIVVSITEPRFNKKQFIFVDPDSLEVLYIQTDVARFSEPDDYFVMREDSHYE
jgi:hypothetical protein